MAEKRSSAKLRVEVPAARIATVELPKVKLDDELVDRVIDMADLRADADRRFDAMQIRAQVRSYLNGQAISRRHMSTSDGRKALRRLDRSFERISKTLEALSVEQSMVLDARLKKRAGKHDVPGLIAAQRKLELLRVAVADTVEVYKPKPGNPELTGLEMIVGALMLLFEMESGKRASVSMTKDGEHAPRATSPQAKAITHLLTAIDPALDDQTVVTKIHKLAKKHCGKSLGKFRMALWLPMQRVVPIPAEPKV